MLFKVPKHTTGDTLTVIFDISKYKVSGQRKFGWAYEIASSQWRG